jgi:hypothetical protein
VAHGVLELLVLGEVGGAAGPSDLALDVEGLEFGADAGEVGWVAL